jgi:hypothetical protein
MALKHEYSGILAFFDQATLYLIPSVDIAKVCRNGILPIFKTES